MKERAKCLNCQSPIEETDKYCSNCGQEVKDLKISFWEFASDFLSSNFNFDTKLGRTFIDLLFKPGEITKQFNNGKRVRYVKPVQMYLFVSFIYFLLLGLEPASFVNKTPPTDAQIEELNQSQIAEINIDGTELQGIAERFEKTDPNNEQELDSLLLHLGEEEITSWKRHLIKQAVRSLNPTHEEQLTKEVYANLSIGLFFLLPLFAMILWLFTKKNSPFYMSALVFSVHFHSVVLLILSLSMLADMVIAESTAFKISLILILMYLWLAVKRVFEYKWVRSLGKTLALLAIYSVCFGFSYLGILFISFLIY